MGYAGEMVACTSLAAIMLHIEALSLVESTIDMEVSLADLQALLSSVKPIWRYPIAGVLFCTFLELFYA
jgi:hypothetical protein